MPYFIKRGDKVQGPIGHEQLMSLASQNRLKQSDWISVSKDGPYQKLAVAWDFIKHSDQNWTKPTPEDSTGSHLHKKTTDLKSIFVAVFEDIANPSNKAKYISISSTIAGLFAFLFLSFTFICALFSIAGIIFGCVSILRFEKYRTLGYVGVGFSCLAFMCLINNTANNAAIEKRRNEIAQAKLAEGKKLNQEEAAARVSKFNQKKLRKELGEINVSFDVQITSDKKVKFSGKTNLPEGTKLSLGITERSLAGSEWDEYFHWEDAVVNAAGLFESPKIFTDGWSQGLPDSIYIAEMWTPVAAAQSAYVQSIIGNKGENLKGPFVEELNGFNIVRFKEQFSIGTPGTQKQRHKQIPDDIENLKNDLCYHLYQLLQFKDDPKFKEFGFSVGGPYNKWLISIETLRKKTETKGKRRSPIPISLRTTPYRLEQFGMDFIKGENDFIRELLPKVKERIGYAEYIRNLKTESPRPIQKAAENTRGAVDKRSYDKIQIGMSYPEVVNLLGRRGSVVSETESLGQTMTMYEWETGSGFDLANCSVLFHNGEVISKSQIGLK